MTRAKKKTETQEFIPCTIIQLPEAEAPIAASTAICQNPNNQPAQDLEVLPPSYLAVLTTKYWGAEGTRLTVGFMETTPADLRDRIIGHMNAWSEYANVRFEYSVQEPQVRITRSGQGYWSYLGTDILHIPRSQPTMCLQGFTMRTSEAEYKRVVRHETGHTLGFPHEHMRTEIIEQLDVTKTILYFRRTQGWSASMVRAQVLTPLDERSIMASPYADETSIMCYRLPGSITKDGQPIVGGDDIAPQDKAFVGKIYPLPVAPPPEPGLPAGVLIQMDLKKKQLAVRLPEGWEVVRA